MDPQTLSRRGFIAALAAGFPLTAKALSSEPDGCGEVPWLTEVQRPPKRLPADAPKLSAPIIDDRQRAVLDLPAWEKQREAIRRRWREFLGQVKVDRAAPPDIQILEEDRPKGVVRQLVQYEAEPGVPVKAYLIRPDRIERPCPGAVVFHSTVGHTIRQPAGLEGTPSKAFGLKLARQGFVTLSPRCFLWGDDPSVTYQEHVRRFHDRHPGCKGMAKMLHDGVVAVDILAGMSEVDSKRLATVGHSLGAKEVLYLAAFDERIRAAVSSEGGIGTRFSNWDAPWYLGEAIRDGSFPHEHHELLSLVAPRAFLLVGGDSADGDRSWPFISEAMPAFNFYRHPTQIGQPRLDGRVVAAVRNFQMRVGLLNHTQGHCVPPEAEQRIYEWLTTYT